MTSPPSTSTSKLRLAAAPAVALMAVLAAACAAALPDPTGHVAAPNTGHWPPPWQGAVSVDDGVPAFDPPTADHCRRAPTTREVPGRSGDAQGHRSLDDRLGARGGARRDEAAKSAAAPALLGGFAARAPAVSEERPVAAPPPAPEPGGSLAAPRRRPRQEPVTAGMVDDNADFGEYLAYRARHRGLPVRERDITERHLLEVTDAAGRPVHDAEVALQRAGRREPILWARTDTAGRVWLHPRAVGAGADRTLGVAVRKGGATASATLARDDRAALQVRLDDAPAPQRPRLDLVFLIDATGSMGDEIAKLKTSMRAIAQQIGQLPGQPDTCYGLVAYRDRGDAFLTRTHDFTDDLGAFQGVLARVQAGGGGDTPEALNEALHETVHGLSWRADAARLVVLVADAPPHLDYGGPQYDRDMQAALAKGIKLFAVGASGLDPVGEYVYRQLAQYTAGRFVFLTYRDASDPGSGPGTQTPHDVGQYSVQTLDRLIVRLVGEEMARLARG
ncbi:MAG: VWA domain-containing protein [Piscinibacter sp.]|nr:VWA domain-containing protein [Piscinibacter sp.]